MSRTHRCAILRQTCARPLRPPPDASSSPSSRLSSQRSTARVSRTRMAEPTFEEAQAELEQIVARLEQGQASLDEALKLWERGEELYAVCRAKLDAAQGKVEELARRVEQARP